MPIDVSDNNVGTISASQANVVKLIRAMIENSAVAGANYRVDTITDVFGQDAMYNYLKWNTADFSGNYDMSYCNADGTYAASKLTAQQFDRTKTYDGAARPYARNNIENDAEAAFVNNTSFFAVLLLAQIDIYTVLTEFYPDVTYARFIDAVDIATKERTTRLSAIHSDPHLSDGFGADVSGQYDPTAFNPRQYDFINLRQGVDVLPHRVTAIDMWKGTDASSGAWNIWLNIDPNNAGNQSADGFISFISRIFSFHDYGYYDNSGINTTQLLIRELIRDFPTELESWTQTSPGSSYSLTNLTNAYFDYAGLQNIIYDGNNFIITIETLLYAQINIANILLAFPEETAPSFFYKGYATATYLRQLYFIDNQINFAQFIGYGDLNDLSNNIQAFFNSNNPTLNETRKQNVISMNGVQGYSSTDASYVALNPYVLVYEQNDMSGNGFTYDASSAFFDSDVQNIYNKPVYFGINPDYPDTPVAGDSYNLLEAFKTFFTSYYVYYDINTDTEKEYNYNSNPKSPAEIMSIIYANVYINPLFNIPGFSTSAIGLDVSYGPIQKIRLDELRTKMGYTVEELVNTSLNASPFTVNDFVADAYSTKNTGRSLSLYEINSIYEYSISQIYNGIFYVSDNSSEFSAFYNVSIAPGLDIKNQGDIAYALGELKATYGRSGSGDGYYIVNHGSFSLIGLVNNLYVNVSDVNEGWDIPSIQFFIPTYTKEEIRSLYFSSNDIDFGAFISYGLTIIDISNVLQYTVDPSYNNYSLLYEGSDFSGNAFYLHDDINDSNLLSAFTITLVDDRIPRVPNRFSYNEPSYANNALNDVIGIIYDNVYTNGQYNTHISLDELRTKVGIAYYYLTNYFGIDYLTQESFGLNRPVTSSIALYDMRVIYDYSISSIYNSIFSVQSINTNNQSDITTTLGYLKASLGKCTGNGIDNDKLQFNSSSNVSSTGGAFTLLDLVGNLVINGSDGIEGWDIPSIQFFVPTYTPVDIRKLYFVDKEITFSTFVSNGISASTLTDYTLNRPFNAFQFVYEYNDVSLNGLNDHPFDLSYQSFYNNNKSNIYNISIDFENQYTYDLKDAFHALFQSNYNSTPYSYDPGYMNITGYGSNNVQNLSYGDVVKNVVYQNVYMDASHNVRKISIQELVTKMGYTYQDLLGNDVININDLVAEAYSQGPGHPSLSLYDIVYTWGASISELYNAIYAVSNDQTTYPNLTLQYGLSSYSQNDIAYVLGELKDTVGTGAVAGDTFTLIELVNALLVNTSDVVDGWDIPTIQFFMPTYTPQDIRRLYFVNKTIQFGTFISNGIIPADLNENGYTFDGSTSFTTTNFNAYKLVYEFNDIGLSDLPGDLSYNAFYTDSSGTGFGSYTLINIYNGNDNNGNDLKNAFYGVYEYGYFYGDLDYIPGFKTNYNNIEGYEPLINLIYNNVYMDAARTRKIRLDEMRTKMGYAYGELINTPFSLNDFVAEAFSTENTGPSLALYDLYNIYGFTIDEIYNGLLYVSNNHTNYSNLSLNDPYAQHGPSSNYSLSLSGLTYNLSDNAPQDISMGSPSDITILLGYLRNTEGICKLYDNYANGNSVGSQFPLIDIMNDLLVNYSNYRDNDTYDINSIAYFYPTWSALEIRTLYFVDGSISSNTLTDNGLYLNLLGADDVVNKNTPLVNTNGNIRDILYSVTAYKNSSNIGIPIENYTPAEIAYLVLQLPCRNVDNSTPINYTTYNPTSTNCFDPTINGPLNYTAIDLLKNYGTNDALYILGASHPARTFTKYELNALACNPGYGYEYLNYPLLSVNELIPHTDLTLTKFDDNQSDYVFLLYGNSVTNQTDIKGIMSALYPSPYTNTDLAYLILSLAINSDDNTLVVPHDEILIQYYNAGVDNSGNTTYGSFDRDEVRGMCFVDTNNALTLHSSKSIPYLTPQELTTIRQSEINDRELDFVHDYDYALLTLSDTYPTIGEIKNILISINDFSGNYPDNGEIYKNVSIAYYQIPHQNISGNAQMDYENYFNRGVAYLYGGLFTRNDIRSLWLKPYDGTTPAFTYFQLTGGYSTASPPVLYQLGFATDVLNNNDDGNTGANLFEQLVNYNEMNEADAAQIIRQMLYSANDLSGNDKFHAQPFQLVDMGFDPLVVRDLPAIANYTVFISDETRDITVQASLPIVETGILIPIFHAGPSNHIGYTTDSSSVYYPIVTDFYHYYDLYEINDTYEYTYTQLLHQNTDASRNVYVGLDLSNNNSYFLPNWLSSRRMAVELRQGGYTIGDAIQALKTANYYTSDNTGPSEANLTTDFSYNLNDTSNFHIYDTSVTYVQMWTLEDLNNENSSAFAKDLLYNLSQSSETLRNNYNSGAITFNNMTENLVISGQYTLVDGKLCHLQMLYADDLYNNYYNIREVASQNGYSDASSALFMLSLPISPENPLHPTPIDLVEKYGYSKTTVENIVGETFRWTETYNTFRFVDKKPDGSTDADLTIVSAGQANLTVLGTSTRFNGMLVTDDSFSYKGAQDTDPSFNYPGYTWPNYINKSSNTIDTNTGANKLSIDAYITANNHYFNPSTSADYTRLYALLYKINNYFDYSVTDMLSFFHDIIYFPALILSVGEVATRLTVAGYPIDDVVKFSPATDGNGSYNLSSDTSFNYHLLNQMNEAIDLSNQIQPLFYYDASFTFDLTGPYGYISDNYDGNFIVDNYSPSVTINDPSTVGTFGHFTKHQIDTYFFQTQAYTGHLLNTKYSFEYEYVRDIFYNNNDGFSTYNYGYNVSKFLTNGTYIKYFLYARDTNINGDLVAWTTLYDLYASENDASFISIVTNTNGVTGTNTTDKLLQFVYNSYNLGESQVLAVYGSEQFTTLKDIEYMYVLHEEENLNYPFADLSSNTNNPPTGVATILHMRDSFPIGEFYAEVIDYVNNAATFASNHTDFSYNMQYSDFYHYWVKYELIDYINYHGDNYNVKIRDVVDIYQGFGIAISDFTLNQLALDNTIALVRVANSCFATSYPTKSSRYPTGKELQLAGIDASSNYSSNAGTDGSVSPYTRNQWTIANIRALYYKDASLSDITVGTLYNQYDYTTDVSCSYIPGDNRNTSSPIVYPNDTTNGGKTYIRFANLVGAVDASGDVVLGNGDYSLVYAEDWKLRDDLTNLANLAAGNNNGNIYTALEQNYSLIALELAYAGYDESDSIKHNNGSVLATYDELRTVLGFTGKQIALVYGADLVVPLADDGRDANNNTTNNNGDGKIHTRDTYSYSNVYNHDSSYNSSWMVFKYEYGFSAADIAQNSSTAIGVNLLNQDLSNTSLSGYSVDVAANSTSPTSTGPSTTIAGFSSSDVIEAFGVTYTTDKAYPVDFTLGVDNGPNDYINKFDQLVDYGYNNSYDNSGLVPLQNTRNAAGTRAFYNLFNYSLQLNDTNATAIGFSGSSNYFTHYTTQSYKDAVDDLSTNNLSLSNIKNITICQYLHNKTQYRTLYDMNGIAYSYSPNAYTYRYTYLQITDENDSIITDFGTDASYNNTLQNIYMYNLFTVLQQINTGVTVPALWDDGQGVEVPELVLTIQKSVMNPNHYNNDLSFNQQSLSMNTYVFQQLYPYIPLTNLIDKYVPFYHNGDDIENIYTSNPSGTRYVTVSTALQGVDGNWGLLFDEATNTYYVDPNSDVPSIDQVLIALIGQDSAQMVSDGVISATEQAAIDEIEAAFNKLDLSGNLLSPDYTIGNYNQYIASVLQQVAIVQAQNIPLDFAQLIFNVTILVRANIYTRYQKRTLFVDLSGAFYTLETFYDAYTASDLAFINMNTAFNGIDASSNYAPFSDLSGSELYAAKDVVNLKYPYADYYNFDNTFYDINAYHIFTAYELLSSYQSELQGYSDDGFLYGIAGQLIWHTVAERSEIIDTFYPVEDEQDPNNFVELKYDPSGTSYDPVTGVFTPNYGYFEGSNYYYAYPENFGLLVDYARSVQREFYKADTRYGRGTSTDPKLNILVALKYLTIPEVINLKYPIYAYSPVSNPKVNFTAYQLLTATDVAYIDSDTNGVMTATVGRLLWSNMKDRDEIIDRFYTSTNNLTYNPLTGDNSLYTSPDSGESHYYYSFPSHINDLTDINPDN